ncbi:MAG: DUF3570 domain-containing protein [Methylovulum sp.]|uniref:DUF3570 domain-containing protein n=1 Tax=Methylovulum sp. TaxID=1916980 RepID=UPI002625E510|nr:DUF3570 domain-containing protein [Methylovulum sp.]MDD2724320.1 DUF3570 domain-containing protein [Methylovulum sp.]MDD5124964.1 DUF3570 domain-containing protein [Methylovulum sp.]
MKKITKEITGHQINGNQDNPRSSLSLPLQVLTAAALLLPGLLMSTAKAAEEDSVDFQYSHYQEGKRDIYGLVPNIVPGVSVNFLDTKLPQNLNPIEVDSVHGSGRFTLTDRIKFAFNYTQDTWSGATPLGTAPVVAVVNLARGVRDNLGNLTTVTGASPFAQASNGAEYFIDRNLNFLNRSIDLTTGNQTFGPIDNRLTHVMSYASPETRKQGDFKLSYQWDEAALDIGGGISIENDYESRFGSVGGRFDFNRKLTTLNWGTSYTNSDTFATLDPDGLPFFDISKYDTSLVSGTIITKKKPEVAAGYVDSTYTVDGTLTNAILHGNRQDWGTQLGLSQVLDKNSLLSLDLAYTRSTGYLSNPYKLVYFHNVSFHTGEDVGVVTGSKALLEVRPDERNLFNWHLGYNRYIEPFDAALHVNYHFAHDNWGIQAHTFEGDWVQPLGAGWAVTPHIRYYSQSAADFYTNTGIFLISENGEITREIPKFYSSDQRLSGFGTLSGGVTVEKKFAKGVSLETGFEYYTHQGNLKIGGGGEQAFADYDYWVANAALKVNLGALSFGGGSHDGHGGHHHHHANSPAGVMFDHTLPKAGDFMAGYRFMRNDQAGKMLQGSHPVSLGAVNANGCGDRECAVTPNFMAMNMHMLDLMVAPTDSLTLMLMPQWMDMEMTMTPNDNVQLSGGGHGGHGATHAHQTGGIGDFGAYALFKAFDHPNHHLTLSLGGTAPTGDVGITLRKTAINPVDDQLIHYGMQLGSGTWDFKPALTYAGGLDNFLWGAQATATLRLEDQNKSGYRLGDIFQSSVWGGYNWTNWLATTVRGVYTWQDRIYGVIHPSQTQVSDPNTGELVPFVPQHIGPFDFPANYGGQYVDLGLGVNVTVPSGAFQGNALKFEWLQPVHTDYNGYQLDRDYALNFTWSYGF